MVVEGSAADVTVTNCFTGVDASFLIPSLVDNGLDPAALHRPDDAAPSIAGGGANPKAWRDIWSAGQGIGAVTRAEPAATYIDRLVAEYQAARRDLGCAA
jgi:nitronate monooxygenase